MNTITIDMRLFGAFRPYGEAVSFQVPYDSPVSAIKSALAEALGAGARDLVADSVVADDQAILPEDYIVGADAKLSILPPVCGG
jgi:hypothetical protein